MYFFFVLENVFLIFIRKMWLLYRKASMMFSTFTERNGTERFHISFPVFLLLSLSLSLPIPIFIELRVMSEVRQYRFRKL